MVAEQFTDGFAFDDPRPQPPEKPKHEPAAAISFAGDKNTEERPRREGSIPTMDHACRPRK